MRTHWLGQLLIAAIVIPMLWGLAWTTEAPVILEAPSVSMWASPTSADKAFAEAAGWGADALTTCNRDTVFVHRVTTTNKTGTGSFNEAINNLHPDTLDIIIFTVSGWTLASAHWDNDDDNADCVYVAGQTSPGDGIAFHSRTRMWRLEDGRDLVVRGLTFAGDSAYDHSTPSIQLEDVERFIWHENEHWWTTEKDISLQPSDNTDSVMYGTISSTLFAEPINEYTSIQVSPVNDAVTGTVSYLSFYGNLWHTGGWRNPNMSSAAAWPKRGHVADFRGNVWYNTLRAAMQLAGWDSVTWYDSYWQQGPQTPAYSYGISIRTENVGGRHDSVNGLYAERVIGKRNRDTTIHVDSLWAAGGAYQEITCFDDDDNCEPGDNPVATLPNVKLASPPGQQPTFPYPRVNPFTQKVTLYGTATDSGQVGNWRRIQCDGTWAERSDSVHAALLKHAQDSTGLSTQRTAAAVEAMEEYTRTSGSACTDSDADGMPNEFELLCGGSSTALAPDGDISGDGYTNIEEYINGSSAIRTIAWDDASVGEDGFIIYKDTGAGFVAYDTVGANVTSYTDTNSAIGHRYRVVSYSGLAESSPSNTIVSTCN